MTVNRETIQFAVIMMIIMMITIMIQSLVMIKKIKRTIIDDYDIINDDPYMRMYVYAYIYKCII
jgi:hypothetical protein